MITSVVVQIEVLTYPDSPEKLPLVEDFVNLALLLPLDKDVAKKAIDIRRSKRNFKIGDAIIAATALVHQPISASNKTKNFINIKGLHVVDPLRGS